MKLNNLAFPVLLVVLLLISCKDDDAPIVIGPPPVTDPQPQQYGTPFGNVPDVPDVQMYEVNPRVFSPAKNLDGITERLDSIKKLGINVVWLMPIYQTGSERSVGSPYSIRDYFSIHSDYGNLTDLRELVDKAHSLDIAVMLDWVANQTAWDNEWTANKSWYTQDGNGDIIHPPGTNWQDVAELNFNNSDLRAAMIKAMKYWVLEANVDGYRCDYATGVPLDFWKQAIDTLRKIPNRNLLLFAESDDKALLSAGFDIIFGWPFYGKLLEVFGGQSANGLYTAHQNEYSGLTDGQAVLRWTTNHDQHAWDGTPEDLFGGKDAAMAAFILASHFGGIPLVYNGQEVATPSQLPFFENGNATINWSANPTTKATYEKVLNFRKNSEALKRGELQYYISQDVVIFKRKLADEEVLVMVNVRNSTMTHGLPSSIANTAWMDAYTGEEVQLGASVNLGAYQFLVLKNG